MTNLIRKAVERLPGHWHKGGLQDHKGNFCGVGHLWQVGELADYTVVDECQNLMNMTAGELFPDRAGKVIPAFATFNDHPDTTEDEVIAVMEKAAIRWDERV